jgi:hypothetical protein
VVSNQEVVDISKILCVDMEHGGGPLATCEEIVEVAVAIKS